MSEGVIKFTCQWQKSDPLPSRIIADLSLWRQAMYAKGLIGAYPSGIGFGNISQRIPDGTFVITGSATGHLSVLGDAHFTRVVDYSIEANSVRCEGPIIASSESMTHAVLYSCSPAIGAVVHVHSRLLWNKFLGDAPTTSALVEYGTPQMAHEVRRLYLGSNLPQTKFLVMAGHEEGVVAFGATPQEACGVIFERMGVAGVAMHQ